MFNNTTHRPATIQRIRIGATRDGKLTAIGHESWSGDLPGGKPETAVQPDPPALRRRQPHDGTRLAVLDLPEGNAMRAPGEAPGLMALEIAMDEMAEKLGMDPVEFRILNDTRSIPEKPERRSRSAAWSNACAPAPSASAGTSAIRSPARSRRPLAGRHGRGGGLPQQPRDEVGARVRLDKPRHRDGRNRHDRHRHRQLHHHRPDRGRDDGRAAGQGRGALGDSNFPVSAGSGGQWGANSSTAGVYAACVKLREAVAQKLGFNPATRFRRRQVRAGGAACRWPGGRAGRRLVAEDTWSTATSTRSTSSRPSARTFVEVGVDAATGEIRVRRMLAVCAAGRILNPKTARSQVIGAMTMGVGAALMEELVVDKRIGFFVNHDLAGYEVPVHADIPHQEVIFLDETDPMSSPMKAKGVGELGICGVGAAVANAIYNATGVRVRDYPITLDKLRQLLAGRIVA
jgi:xanthine dehydrogenase YagR molybdenum-binding subunit